jgi:hypothetical protein
LTIPAQKTRWVIRGRPRLEVIVDWYSVFVCLQDSPRTSRALFLPFFPTLLLSSGRECLNDAAFFGQGTLSLFYYGLLPFTTLFVSSSLAFLTLLFSCFPRLVHEERRGDVTCSPRGLCAAKCSFVLDVGHVGHPTCRRKMLRTQTQLWFVVCRVLKLALKPDIFKGFSEDSDAPAGMSLGGTVRFRKTL